MIYRPLTASGFAVSRFPVAYGAKLGCGKCGAGVGIGVGMQQKKPTKQLNFSRLNVLCKNIVWEVLLMVWDGLHLVAYL